MAQGFLSVAGDAINDHAAVGSGAAHRAQDLFHIWIIKPQHAGLEFLFMKKLYRVAIHGDHMNVELPETVVQKSNAVLIQTHTCNFGYDLGDSQP